MIEITEFERWIKSVHNIFEIFEGRFDAYPISRRWIDEWYSKGYFNILDNDIERLYKLKEGFDYSVFRIENPTSKENIDNQFEQMINKLKRINSCSNSCKDIGIGIAPYLFSWNFQRFKEYFLKKRNFNLIQYFQSLGEFFDSMKHRLKHFYRMRIYSSKIDEKEIKEIFNEINKFV